MLARLLKQKRSVAAALMYILALGRDVRANCWDLSEKAGLEPGDGRFHRLLGRYRWSWERGREMLPLLAQEALGTDPDADDEIGPGLAVDETTDLKRGMATACVSPQHSGVTGKTENCVTWVFSALVTATGQCWAWFDLYMPECWAKDPDRRKKAGIPRGLQFATKPELAIAQVKTIIERGVRVCWVAADEVYGRSGDFRAACRALLLSYVVIIPCDYKVTLAKGTAKVSAKDAARDAVFEWRSAGNGTKGPRRAWWALIATEDPDEFLLVQETGPGEEPVHVLPVPRCPRPPGDPELFRDHRWKALAGRNQFQKREGRLRLGPVPGRHLDRAEPPHPPDRPGHDPRHFPPQLPGQRNHGHGTTARPGARSGRRHRGHRRHQP